MTSNDLNIDNFAERTGLRFRINKEQAARIALTRADQATRQSLVGLNKEEAADVLNARNKNNKPLNWVELAAKMADGWDGSLALTREQAFEDFLAEGGLERLQNRPVDIPLSVYLDADLTLENFSAKVEEAIGSPRRFRASQEQHALIKSGQMTREEALQQVIEEKRAEAEAATPADETTETVSN